MPTRKPKKKTRTTISSMPTKTATKVTTNSPAKRNIQVSKSIAKKRVIKAAENSANKVKGSSYIALMRTEKAYNEGASAEAKKLGYKTTGGMSRYGSTIKKSNTSQGKVTGVKSKTVGSPSVSKTTTKRKYKKQS